MNASNILLSQIVEILGVDSDLPEKQLRVSSRRSGQILEPSGVLYQPNKSGHCPHRRMAPLVKRQTMKSKITFCPDLPFIGIVS
jgi:hypothetical protein